MVKWPKNEVETMAVSKDACRRAFHDLWMARCDPQELVELCIREDPAVIKNILGFIMEFDKVKGPFIKYCYEVLGIILMQLHGYYRLHNNSV